MERIRALAILLTVAPLATATVTACAPASRAAAYEAVSATSVPYDPAAAATTAPVEAGPEGTKDPKSTSAATEPKEAPASAPTESFLLELDTDYETRDGITVRYELLSHKHAIGGWTLGKYIIRLSRFDETGAIEFDVVGKIDNYGESPAFGSLLRRLGTERSGRLRVELHPMPPPKSRPTEADVDAIMERLRPEGTFSTSHAEEYGAHRIAFADARDCVLLRAVVGAETGDILYLGTPEDPCAGKGRAVKPRKGRKKGKKK